MAKKANNAAPKSAKINPEMDAPEWDAPQSIPSPDAQTASKPEDDFRAKLVAKAQAAMQAAKFGLMPQSEADAIWKEAEEACKPTEESIALAKIAKEMKDEAEKVLKAA